MQIINVKTTDIGQDFFDAEITPVILLVPDDMTVWAWEARVIAVSIEYFF